MNKGSSNFIFVIILILFRKKFNRLRPLKSIKKSKDVQKKKDYGDYSSFKEYHEYLELFADNDCSLFNDLKTKEKTNADIFREILLKSRIKANIPQLKSRSPLQSQEKKNSQDLLNGKSKNSVVAFNRDSSMILSMTFKGDSSRDVFNKSNTFNPSNSNLIISQQRTLVSKKQSPAETYVSGKEEIGYHKPNNRSFAQEKSFTAERIQVLDSKDVLDLKDKILRHVNDRPRFNRKEIPFQFDKNFIGSRKIQERKFDFERRNGLLPRTLLNLSFGK